MGGVANAGHPDERDGRICKISAGAGVLLEPRLGDPPGHRALAAGSPLDEVETAASAASPHESPHVSQTTMTVRSPSVKLTATGSPQLCRQGSVPSDGSSGAGGRLHHPVFGRRRIKRAPAASRLARVARRPAQSGRMAPDRRGCRATSVSSAIAHRPPERSAACLRLPSPSGCAGSAGEPKERSGYERRQRRGKRRTRGNAAHVRPCARRLAALLHRRFRMVGDELGPAG